MNEATQTEDPRTRILKAAAELIESGGREAATTRAVSDAAGVQPPTIYRLFGDKLGLLDAVAAQELSTYVAGKVRRKPHPDPVQDLRDGWDMHVAFGLDHPGLFAILWGDPSARPRPAAPALAAGRDVLKQRVRRVAQAGRLKIGEEQAVALLEAVGTGTVLTLLGQSREQRDKALSETAREAVLAAIIGETVSSGPPGPAGAAVALRASLDQTSVLSAGERHLLEELLVRIVSAN